MNMNQMLYRSAPVDLHIYDDVALPLAVSNFLAKGDKLVPHRAPSDWNRFRIATDTFAWSLYWKMSFAGEAQTKPNELTGLKRFSQCPTTGLRNWDNIADVDFNAFRAKVHGRLSWNYQKLLAGYRPDCNLSFADHWARQWLFENRSECIDAPADKSLALLLLLLRPLLMTALQLGSLPSLLLQCRWKMPFLM